MLVCTGLTGLYHTMYLDVTCQIMKSLSVSADKSRSMRSCCGAKMINITAAMGIRPCTNRSKQSSISP